MNVKKIDIKNNKNFYILHVNKNVWFKGKNK